jgi:hypothetical protein
MATPLNITDLMNTMLPLIMFMMVMQMMTGMMKEFKT